MPTKQQNGSKHKVSNLESGLDILEVLRDCPQGLGLTAIAKELGLTKNLAFRIASTLLERGYLLRCEETQRFTLSRKLLTMGYGVEAENGVVECALGEMRRLRDEFRETVVICTISGTEGIVLESIPGLDLFRFVCQTGMRFPIHVSAPTKAMLAFMPEQQALELLLQAGTPRMTSRTITTQSRWKTELRRIREQGYATDRQEGYEGIHCVGAAILGDKGEPVAAINVTGPSNRMPETCFEEMGRRIKTACDSIAEKLGYAGSY